MQVNSLVLYTFISMQTYLCNPHASFVNYPYVLATFTYSLHSHDISHRELFTFRDHPEEVQLFFVSVSLLFYTCSAFFFSSNLVSNYQGKRHIRRRLYLYKILSEISFYRVLHRIRGTSLTATMCKPRKMSLILPGCLADATE